MKIIFLDTPAFAKQDMIDAFEASHVSCDLFFHPAYNERFDKAFETAFYDFAEHDNYDFVFSFNYFPVLSNCCQKYGIPYVSYIYDCPLTALYSCSLINSCNYVFLFDKTTYLTFKNAGIPTVYYLPLAANVKRLSSMTCPPELALRLSSAVSFVGSLYNEDHNFYDRLTSISDYTRGYLDSIMNAQQNVYGTFFLEDLLTAPVLADLQKCIPYQPLPDGTESPAYVYANYFLCRKITCNERHDLLKAASEQFQLKLYTHNPPADMPAAEYVGPIDWYSVMPLVFKNTCINLNITLKSIQSGIPLRGMDIMGSGGFLLTNYQNDFLDFFISDEDFVFYENSEDFLSKIRYYLQHDTERRQIAANGFGKIKDMHTFSHRVHTILNILKN